MDDINIREFKIEDSVLMLEWMHDTEIQKCFKKNMLEMNNEDARNFCKSCNYGELKNGDCRHFAIVDKNDEYLGTISLKNIDLIKKCAEYAVVVRKCYQGKGVAYKATECIKKKAFEDYKLQYIYLYVLENNHKAISAYERYGFEYVRTIKNHIIIDGENRNQKYFRLNK